MIATLITWSQCLQHPFNEKSELVILIILLVLDTIINVVVIAEGILMPKVFVQTKNKFEELLSHLETRLNVCLPMAEFKRNFLLKFFVSISILFGKTLVIPLRRSFRVSDALLLMISNYKHFTAIHILLYIDFLQFIFGAINSQLIAIHRLRRQCAAVLPFQSSANEVVFCLKLYKLVHFKLWKIRQLVVRRFGLILIPLMLANVLEISYSAYWIIVYCISDRESHVIIRKYENKT